MNPIMVDSSLSNRLQQIGESVELCDPAGRVFGRFLPLADLSEWEPLAPELSDDEVLERIRRNEPTHSTADVLAHLERLK